MKKLLMLFSLLITSITFNIQAGNGPSTPALIKSNKTKPSSPIQKFLSLFACAAPEKEITKIHYPSNVKVEETDITLAPEDIDYDLLGSSAVAGEKGVTAIHHPPAVQKEISEQPIEDKNITALLDSFEARSCDGNKHLSSEKAPTVIVIIEKYHVEIEKASEKKPSMQPKKRRV